MNLNFVKHHEIFLRQDIKSNYRNTAGTICPIYSLTRTNLELPKRQNVKHKSIKSTIFEIRLYSKIVQLSRVKLFINNPKTIEKSSKYIQSFYAEKFISKIFNKNFEKLQTDDVPSNRGRAIQKFVENETLHEIGFFDVLKTRTVNWLTKSEIVQKNKF